MKDNNTGGNRRLRRALIAAVLAVGAAGGVGIGVAHAVTTQSPAVHAPSVTGSPQPVKDSDQHDRPGQPDLPEPGDTADNARAVPGQPDVPESGDTADNAHDVPGQPDLPEPGDIPDTP